MELKIYFVVRHLCTIHDEYLDNVQHVIERTKGFLSLRHFIK